MGTGTLTPAPPLLARDRCVDPTCEQDVEEVIAAREPSLARCPRVSPARCIPTRLTHPLRGARALTAYHIRGPDRRHPSAWPRPHGRGQSLSRFLRKWPVGHRCGLTRSGWPTASSTWLSTTLEDWTVATPCIPAVIATSGGHGRLATR